MSTYQIDPAHSAAYFKVRHMMIANVRGQFGNVTGSVDFDPSNLAASRIEATIDTTGLTTGQPPRDAHIKGADFFDVEKYPTITFRSKSIAADGKDSYKAIGDLTFRGVTHEVVLRIEAVSPEIKDPWGLMRRGTSATTRLNRKDFGVAFHAPLESGGVMVGDEVDVSLDVEFTRKAE